MKAGFYPKLAFDGIRKNRRLYLPYVLTCVGMVMMFYILTFLQQTPALDALPGTDTIRVTLGFGSWVVAIFACIFLFYTNSFLMRRRKKEFGLYSILGMGKGNIGHILFWESLMIAVFSTVVGLAAGMALSKLAELGLVALMQGEATYTLSASSDAVLQTSAVFGFIFLLLFLNTLRQVRFSSAVSLLHSEAVGEKPPKGNWFLGTLGLLLLGAGYYIAVAMADPLSALSMFFVAVILVILGTYLLMISGSVLLCRLLQKKKAYYYKSNHFISVSSMGYRMKRNGAGLGSICIMACMVLVMISSTAALYFGAEDALRSRYPSEMNLQVQYADPASLTGGGTSSLRDKVQAIADAQGAQLTGVTDYRVASIAGVVQNGVIVTDPKEVNTLSAATLSGVAQFFLLPLSDYNTCMGTAETLEDGEALLYVLRTDYDADTIAFRGGSTFRIKKQVDSFMGSGDAVMSLIPTIAIIVPDFSAAIAPMASWTDSRGDPALILKWNYNFDTGLSAQGQVDLYRSLKDALRAEEIAGTADYYAQNLDSREANRTDFYATFGGLFYLGIILSIVFLFATVLMIYYKQVCEGYEDQRRFGIMQKVGMTEKDIRRSINSQLLTVFFLPLGLALCHLSFAFPMIRKILLCFHLTNVWLFVLTTVITFLVFAVFYTLVYRATSNAYYNIVSSAKQTADAA